MSIKESIDQDNTEIFMNNNDFAEQHNLNGITCLAVVEGLTSKERSQRKRENYEGVYGNTIIVHVPKSYLTEVPVHGENFRMDGKLYYIDNCDDDFGMLTIELVANSI